MVVIIYAAFIRLRHTAPNKARGFRVPGGRLGMWIVSGVGILGAVAAGILSFVPPTQIKTGSPVIYVGILLLGVALFIALPLIIYARRKKSWRDAGTDFYPFDWQIEGRKPDEISKWPAGYQPTDQQVKDAIGRENQANS